MLQKFGEHMLRNFFGGAPVACKIKWGGPGQPPGLPMLMTTTGSVDSNGRFWAIFIHAVFGVKKRQFLPPLNSLLSGI